MNLTIKRWQQWGIIIPLLALLETSSWGSTNATAGRPPATPGNRFLLILETSKNMQRQGEAALVAIDELFGSGMHGQMRSGDTVGLWTYNDELYAGHLRLQDWTPKNAKDVRERILKFITQQKLEKKGDLKKVLPRMARVINDSEFITVILVNNGEDEIAGTPYDRQINEYYRTWREKQRKGVKPFVTVLRGERGKLTCYSVCQAPGTIDIPPIPPEREATLLAQNKPAPAPVKKTPPPMGKPLIVTGNSRRTETVDGTRTALVAIPPPQPTVREAPKDPRLETAEEIVARLLAEAGQPREITPPLKVISSHGSPSSPASSVSTVSTSNTNAVAAIVSTPRTPGAEQTTVQSNAPANPTPQADPTVTASSLSAVPTKTIDAASTPSRISESPAATEAVAPAAPPESFLQRKPIQRAAMALAAGTVVCLFIAVRRPKPAYQPSIITRSLERESR